MPFNIDNDIPKQSPTSSVVESVDQTTTDNGAGIITSRVFLSGVTVDGIVVPAGPTWATDTITGNPGDFSNVRVGDEISSATGWVSSQTVLSVSTDGSTVTASASNDSVVNSGSEAITFAPASAVNITLYIIRVTHTDPARSLVANVEIATFDGKLAGNNTDDESFANGTLQSGNTIPTFDMATFYANCRIDAPV